MDVIIFSKTITKIFNNGNIFLCDVYFILTKGHVEPCFTQGVLGLLNSYFYSLKRLIVKKKYSLALIAFGFLSFCGFGFAADVLQSVTPPTPMQDHIPVVIVNHTKVDQEVYLVITSLDPDGNPCFVKTDPATGVGHYEYPNADGSNGSVQNSVALSTLPQTVGTGLTR